MSTTHEVTSVTPAPSVWRRLWFPLGVLVLFGAFYAFPWVCVLFDYEPEWAMMAFMVAQWHGPALAVLLLGVWWVFFSPVPWMTRLGVVTLAIVGSVGFYFSIREVELTKSRTGLRPRLHFVWEPTAKEQLAAFLAAQTGGEDLPAIDGSIGTDDFPRYRGITGDGRVALIGLETNWAKRPPEMVWRHPCPGGYSGIAVAGNIVVTLEQRDKGETVACYDRATGRQRWAHSYDASYKDKTKMGDGPRSTPTIHEGRIYTIGATGELVCLDLHGKEQWSRNILTDAKAKNVMWGLTGSPLIVDDLVITNPGVDPESPEGPSLIAYAKSDGKIRWQVGKRKAGYSSPQLVTLAGISQILLFDGAGLVAYEPKEGKELWTFPWETMYEMNSIQPVIIGHDRVFISSEQVNGGAMVRVQMENGKWKAETVWQTKKLGSRYANPVTDGKSLFGLDKLNGLLICLDVATGAVKWKGDREGPGQLLLADGVLIVVNGDNGDVALFDPNASECTELARMPTLEKRDKTWNTPALAGDQLFVRNQAEIACWRLPRR